MTYTILFTDSKLRTAAIVVVAYESGDTSPAIVRHANCKRDYQRAYLLGAGPDGEFSQEPFYVRKRGEENQEVQYALAVLQERLDGTPAQGGLAFGRDVEEPKAVVVKAKITDKCPISRHGWSRPQMKEG